MKTLRKNLLLWAFAVGALMLIGGNVFGSEPDPTESEVPIENGGGNDCVMTQACGGGVCSVLNAKKRLLANGCKKACNYTCTVQSYPWPF